MMLFCAAYHSDFMISCCENSKQYFLSKFTCMNLLQAVQSKTDLLTIHN